MLSTARAALWLTHDVTLASIRQHWMRSLLTLIGVIIGIQVVVAVGVLNRSILGSFQQTIQTIAGSADLQVSNGSAGVPEDLVTALASVEGVQSAEGLIQGTVETANGELTVFGVDLLGDQGIRETQFSKRNVHIKDGLAFANAPDSVAISTSFASRAALTLGSSVAVTAPTGQTTVTVRGLLDPVGPAALFGGDVALVDLPTAQRLFAHEGLVDEIDIALKNPETAQAIAERLRPIVGGAGSIEPPRERGATLGSMLAGVQTVLTLVSLFAVIVGAFIIYHTMETAIAHRRREFALARALGYRRRVLLVAIVVEAIAYGLAGTLIGAVLGIASARVSLALVTGGMAAIWGRVGTSSLSLTPLDLTVAAALGIGSSLVASIMPALAAARVQIIEQLQHQDFEAPRGTDLRGALIGVGCGVLGYGVLSSGLRPSTFVGKVTMIMGGVVVLAVGYAYVTPLVVRIVVSACRMVAARLRPAAPSLAIENVARNPRKYRGTIAALMVAFAMVLIVGAFVQSLRGSILSWLDETLSADLYICAGSHLPLPSGPTFADTIEPDLRSIPGVAEVSGSRMINVRIGDTLAVLRTVTVGGLERHHYPVVEGRLASVPEAFARGDAVLVSDNFAYHHGLHAGDTLSLATPSGERRFQISAVVVDYTLDVGTIVIERETYKRLWKDNLVNGLLVWLSPGADRDGIRATIAQRLTPRFSFTILTGREFSAQLADVLDGALLMTYAVQLVAIAIATIGVVNFFLAEVLDRRREIGLLRSVAFTRRQLRRVLAAEALLVGSIGGLMATLYAWPVARLLVTRSTRLVSGWSLTFDFPVRLAIATVAIAAVTSVLAAYYPAERAARRRISELVLSE
jgi:putative ABC transport system permease protein